MREGLVVEGVRSALFRGTRACAHTLQQSAEWLEEAARSGRPPTHHRLPSPPTPHDLSLSFQNSLERLDPAGVPVRADGAGPVGRGLAIPHADGGQGGAGQEDGGQAGQGGAAGTREGGEGVERERVSFLGGESASNSMMFLRAPADVSPTLGVRPRPLGARAGVGGGHSQDVDS